MTSGKSSHLSTFTVEVKPLPEWVVGTFTGIGRQLFFDESGHDEYYGSHYVGDRFDELGYKDSGILFTLTITSSGKCTCKVVTDFGSCPVNSLNLTRGQDGGLLVYGEGVIVPGDSSDYYCVWFSMSSQIVNGVDVGLAQLLFYHTQTKEYGVWRDTEWKNDVYIMTEEDFPLWQNVWNNKKMKLPENIDGEQYVIDTPDNRGLVLKFSKKGTVTAALWEKNAAKAAVTASGQLSLCGHDAETGVWYGQVCLVLMDKKFKEIGVIVSVKIDSTGNPVCTLEDYVYNWR